MPLGAVLCTNCGYDTRTGKKLAVATAARPANLSAFAAGGKANATVDRMAPQGSFAAGFVVSLLFAVGASIIWIALAYATGVTIGYVAILIGGAAGVGMQIGHKGYSRTGGYAAAVLTLVAILLAKLVVLEMLLSRTASHRSIANLDPAKLGYYFFSPIGLIIIVIGMAAAFRTGMSCGGPSSPASALSVRAVASFTISGMPARAATRRATVNAGARIALASTGQVCAIASSAILASAWSPAAAATLTASRYRTYRMAGDSEFESASRIG
jgi:hypothetical protein